MDKNTLKQILNVTISYSSQSSVPKIDPEKSYSYEEFMKTVLNGYGEIFSDKFVRKLLKYGFIDLTPQTDSFQISGSSITNMIKKHGSISRRINIHDLEEIIEETPIAKPNLPQKPEPNYFPVPENYEDIQPGFFYLVSDIRSKTEISEPTFYKRLNYLLSQDATKELIKKKGKISKAVDGSLVRDLLLRGDWEKKVRQSKSNSKSNKPKPSPINDLKTAKTYLEEHLVFETTADIPLIEKDKLYSPTQFMEDILRVTATTRYNSFNQMEELGLIKTFVPEGKRRKQIKGFEIQKLISKHASVKNQSAQNHKDNSTNSSDKTPLYDLGNNDKDFTELNNAVKDLNIKVTTIDGFPYVKNTDVSALMAHLKELNGEMS